MSVLEEYQFRVTHVETISFNEAPARLSSLHEWLISQAETREIVDSLKADYGARELLAKSDENSPPMAGSPEQIAGVGMCILEKIHEGTVPWMSDNFGVHSGHSWGNLQENLDALMESFINPALQYIERELEDQEEQYDAPDPVQSLYPLAITQSARLFRDDYPEARRAAFVMMQFGKTELHKSVFEAVENCLAPFGIAALRADQKEYHEDLFYNVVTYMYGCGFGVAVFEQFDVNAFNPNVSLEVGYMKAWGKHVCLLKDESLQSLHADLIGKLYRPFNADDPASSIPEVLGSWLREKGIV